MWQLLIPLVLVLCASCQQVPRLTEGMEHPAVVKQAMEYYVPPGTPLDEAKPFMEAEGFSCSLQKNTNIKASDYQSGFEGEDTKGTDYEGVDCLHCRRDRYAGGFITNTTLVTLVLKNDRVIDVITKLWFTGF